MRRPISRRSRPQRASRVPGHRGLARLAVPAAATAVPAAARHAQHGSRRRWGTGAGSGEQCSPNRDRARSLVPTTGALRSWQSRSKRRTSRGPRRRDDGAHHPSGRRPTPGVSRRTASSPLIADGKGGHDTGRDQLETGRVAGESLLRGRACLPFRDELRRSAQPGGNTPKPPVTDPVSHGMSAVSRSSRTTRPAVASGTRLCWITIRRTKLRRRQGPGCRLCP